MTSTITGRVRSISQREPDGYPEGTQSVYTVEILFGSEGSGLAKSYVGQMQTLVLVDPDPECIPKPGATLTWTIA